MTDTYTTAETGLAAYLIASDIKLLDIHRTGASNTTQNYFWAMISFLPDGSCLP